MGLRRDVKDGKITKSEALELLKKWDVPTWFEIYKWVMRRK